MTKPRKRRRQRDDRIVLDHYVAELRHAAIPPETIEQACESAARLDQAH